LARAGSKRARRWAGLAELGLREADISEAAGQIAEAGHANPRPVSVGDVHAILRGVQGPPIGHHPETGPPLSALKGSASQLESRRSRLPQRPRNGAFHRYAAAVSSLLFSFEPVPSWRYRMKAPTSLSPRSSTPPSTTSPVPNDPANRAVVERLIGPNARHRTATQIAVNPRAGDDERRTYALRRTIVPTSRPGRIGAWRVQVFLFARRTSGPATLTDAPPTPSVVNDIGPVERAMLVAGREKSRDQ
jgi:hypothetical protein